MRFPNFSREREKLKAGYHYIVGSDEAGVACLAGPVVAAAVVLDFAKLKKYRGVRDSKLLSPEKRYELEPVIKKYSVGWGIGVVEPKIIDSINIHHASLQAMRLAVQDLFNKFSDIKKAFLYIDGRFKVPGLNVEQEAVVNGDYKIFSVAAASILAKTHRDRMMVEMHETFPAYNFAQHKGYPTREHWKAVRQHGLSPIHRLSFCTNL